MDHKYIRLAFVAALVGFPSLGGTHAANPAWSFQTVDTAGSTGWSSSLAFDPIDGTPSIAFQELNKNLLKFSDWNGSRWITETVATGLSADLKYDSLGRPCLGMNYGAKGEIRFARKEGGRWTFQAVGKGSTPSLAFDAAGNPAIAYVSPNRRANDLTLSRWNGVSWTSVVVEAGVRGTGYVSLAFDAAGNPAIAYSADANLNGAIDTVKFALWNGSAWIREIVDTAVAGGNLGASISLRFDAVGGSFGVAYGSSEAPTGPRFARRTAGVWGFETIEQIPYGFDTSLAFDATGRTYVFYVEGKDPAYELKLAWKDAAGWTIESIDSVYANGSSRSLALGPGGVPAVSYRASSTNELRYAVRSSAP